MTANIKKNIRYILPIIFALFLCIIFIMFYKYYTKNNNKELVIAIDGKKYTYENNSLPSLENNDTFTIKTDYGYNTIEIKDGSICVIDSDCKDKICIHTGKINYERSDDMIICAPHRLCIYIK